MAESMIHYLFIQLNIFDSLNLDMGKMLAKISTLGLLLALCSSRLVYVANVFRHGARYPVSGDIYDGNATKQFHGRLTTVGMRQHLLLGGYLKADYIDQQKLINSTIYMKEVEFFSDSSQRCQESALCHFLGMFPYGTGERLPEGIDPSMLEPPFQSFLSKAQQLTRQDYVKLEEFALNLGFSPVPYKNASLYFPDCPNEAKILEARLESQAIKILELQAINAAFTERMREIFKISVQLSNLVGLIELFDIVTCDRYLGRSLPPDFNDHDYKQLTYIQNYLFALTYGGKPAAVFSTPVLVGILANMDNHVKGGEKPVKAKYSIYSGHDTNVMPLLMFLNMTSPECMTKKWKNETVLGNCAEAPPFASSLIFELHEDDSSSQHTVKIRYNGIYYKMCETESLECEYEEFASRTRRQMVDFTKQCGVKGEQDQSLQQEMIVATE